MNEKKPKFSTKIFHTHKHTDKHPNANIKSSEENQFTFSHSKDWKKARKTKKKPTTVTIALIRRVSEKDGMNESSCGSLMSNCKKTKKSNV